MANHKPDAIALLTAIRAIGPADNANQGSANVKLRKPKSGARAGTRMIAGHFPAATLTALKHLMAEEGTTLQALLDEAIGDLLVKKGRAKQRHT
ncbi:MAG: hypothetical protein C0465_17835 [Ralstonia sp.]|uniref:ribbon-helix-helix domain-containing protein n=1 Tax=Ralstonia sp. TaxID=54061 RepID=UPI002580B990|nr:ribbon-helix-helix domain-containing protein [Ralstonia sp.]MBA4232462.1 hypothetical protein [Ralstonia sp.]